MLGETYRYNSKDTDVSFRLASAFNYAEYFSLKTPDWVASQILCKHQIVAKNRAKVYGLAGRLLPPALPTE